MPTLFPSLPLTRPDRSTLFSLRSSSSRDLRSRKQPHCVHSSFHNPSSRPLFSFRFFSPFPFPPRDRSPARLGEQHARVLRARRPARNCLRIVRRSRDVEQDIVEKRWDESSRMNQSHAPAVDPMEIAEEISRHTPLRL